MDSFYNGLLDHPSYTRPEIFRKMRVPGVLRSGHHEKIRLWRLKESMRNTLIKRPDLLGKIRLNGEQKKILNQIKKEVAK